MTEEWERPRSDEAFEADFTNAVEKGFTLIPDGKYVVVCDDIEPGTTKKGAAKFKITFVVDEGEYAGQKLFKHVPTTGESAGILKSVLHALRPDLEIVKGKVFIAKDDYVGARAEATVRVRDWTDDQGDPQQSSDLKYLRPLKSESDIPF
jgi:hypothetical protein